MIKENGNHELTVCMWVDTAFSLTRPWESDERVHAGLRRVCAGEGSRRASNGGLSDRSPEAMLARARIRKPRIQSRNRALIDISAIDPTGASPSFYDAVQLLHPPKWVTWRSRYFFSLFIFLFSPFLFLSVIMAVLSSFVLLLFYVWSFHDNFYIKIIIKSYIETCA